MSEGNERNLESVTPETAEDIQQQAEESVAAEAVQEVAPDLDDRESAPAKREPKKSKKKKRKKRSVIVPLAIVLALLLVIFGVLVGYGLSRVRSMRAQEQADAQEEDIFAAGLEDVGEIAPYDVFGEELTQQNQQALDALSGEIGFFDDGASALMGEEDLFAAGLSGDEDAAITAPAGDPVVVAEFAGGQQLMSDEVMEEYSNQLSMYILSGYSEAEVAETLLDEVLRSMVSQRVLEAHAREMGLFDLTDEDAAEVGAQASAIYDEYLAYYLASVVNTEGMSEDEAVGAAKAYLLDYEGVTYEGIYDEIAEHWWEQKLYAAITQGVSVDDAAVQAAYDALVAEQKQAFDAYPDDFEFSQMSGELIVYNRSGYRAVKMLLLGFADEGTVMNVYSIAAELAAREGDARAAYLREHQTELDGYYADPEARAAEALEALRGGADMDEMILSEGVDSGMMDARQRAMGYYVSADSMLWPQEFISAAMGLENVGDYSEPVRIDEGVCILQYLGDVPEGPVPLADVRAQLEEDTLVAAEYEAYANQVQAWLDEANPSYYPERMQ